jgi:hypothetical protein
MIEQLSKEKAASPSEEQVVSSQLASLHKSLEVLKLEKETLEQRLLLLSDEQKKASLRLGELKEEYKPLKKEVLDKMYKWLATHQNVRTGLVSSFEGDSELSDSAFIYDQALVALAFTVKGDFDKASRIFSCFQKAKRINGVFANAYYASNADVMEYTVHAGPNIWLGIAILQYTNKTGDKKYLPLALDIVHWVIDFQEADPDKGIKGGPEVSWYSTEHNLDAYAFFNMFYKITSDNKYLKARDNTFNWLKKFAYSNSSLPVKRGKGDSTIATDTYAWSIASIGPKNLASIEMSPIGIVEFAENNCLVNVDFEAIDKKIIKVQGFDFAKAAHIARGGVISCEWTAQMVLTYNIISQYFKNLGDLDKSSVYKEKAELFLSELDKMIITSLSPTGQGEGCLPYASTSFVDTGHGWMTPKGKQTGSLSSTAYAFFAYLGYNPLTLDGKLDF